MHAHSTAVTFFTLAVGPAALRAAEPPVPYPHPLVTELLYAVPPGDKGDASRDGVRDAVGDEFVELVNPHDRPIQLKGYTITDGTPEDPLDASGPARQSRTESRKPNEPAPAENPDAHAAQKQVRFTFPALELKPGEVVVVFNGHKQTIKGPVGDARQAPSAGNESFFGAYVFSMKNDSEYVAFANTADCMIVWDPQGRPVEAIHWRRNVRAGKEQDNGVNKPAAREKATAVKGAPKVATPGPASDRAVAPPGTLLSEGAPESRGSVARVGLSTKLVAHSELPGGTAEPFSPGKFSAAAIDSDEVPARKAQPK